MKTLLAIGVIVCSVVFAFLYFHGKSIDRAQLIYAANALLVAQEQLRQHGSITNTSPSPIVYTFTNHVTVGDSKFACQLATDFAHAGSLAVATDGTLIWIETRREPAVFRTPDGRLEMPRRFKDF